MQGNYSFTVLLVLLGVMIHLPYGRMQRSPYVPMPVNLPGLLPRFGDVDNSASSGQAAPSSSGGNDFANPSQGGSDVGVRVGEEDDRPVDRPLERPSRPLPSRGPARCPPQQVPCYDCMVYISTTGQITKFSPDGRRL